MLLVMHAFTVRERWDSLKAKKPFLLLFIIYSLSLYKSWNVMTKS